MRAQNCFLGRHVKWSKWKSHKNNNFAPPFFELIVISIKNLNILLNYLLCIISQPHRAPLSAYYWASIAELISDHWAAMFGVTDWPRRQYSIFLEKRVLQSLSSTVICQFWGLNFPSGDWIFAVQDSFTISHWTIWVKFLTFWVPGSPNLKILLET